MVLCGHAHGSTEAITFEQIWLDRCVMAPSQMFLLSAVVDMKNDIISCTFNVQQIAAEFAQRHVCRSSGWQVF